MVDGKKIKYVNSNILMNCVSLGDFDNLKSNFFTYPVSHDFSHITHKRKLPDT